MSKICINIAWPYANGPIHLGHVAGSLLPPDVFGRYNRLKGNEVLVVGGSDQHGTPITVTAEKEGVTPAIVADKYHHINKKAIEDMDIQYSLFSKTHGTNHIEVVQNIFNDLLRKGYLYEKETFQYYCENCDRFLPDRYVEGICPACGSNDVRSDQCDACGKTLEPGDLKEPRCIHCREEAGLKETNHYFLRLTAFTDQLLAYVGDKDYWRSNVKSFTMNWLNEGLEDRAVTRDMTWGVPVPIDGWENKVIYVWFEAVIGYLSTSIEYSKMIGKPNLWKDYWKNPEARHYYFIGKDNIPFHSIIWPAMLMGTGGMNLPYDIPANEYLTFNGGKLSKSRGGAIDIPSVLKEYDVDSIRYYLSVNMPDTHDTEFTWDDFQTKINTELVSALGNYYHRCLSFTEKNFGVIPEADDGEGSQEVAQAIESTLKEYNEHLSSCDFKKAIRTVMELSRFGNRYFDSVKPWALIKTDKAACGKVLNNCLRIVKALAVMAWPFMPRSSQTIWEFLGYKGSIESAGLKAVTEPLKAGQKLKEPFPVYKKIETVPVIEKEAPVPDDGGTEDVPFKEFRRLDLRAGRITSAEDHPDAEKLFLLKVDIGEKEPRQVVAGLKAFYSKEQLTGRDVIVISNLKHAKLRGKMSEGMLLAADDESLGGSSVLLLRLSEEVPLGTRIDCGLGSSSNIIEYKDFQEVKMTVSSAKDGKPALTIGAVQYKVPGRAIAVSDGDKTIFLGDGKGAFATVDGEIKDGANVR